MPPYKQQFTLSVQIGEVPKGTLEPGEYALTLFNKRSASHQDAEATFPVLGLLPASLSLKTSGFLISPECLEIVKITSGDPPALQLRWLAQGTLHDAELDIGQQGTLDHLHRIVSAFSAHWTKVTTQATGGGSVPAPLASVPAPKECPRNNEDEGEADGEVKQPDLEVGQGGYRQRDGSPACSGGCGRSPFMIGSFPLSDPRAQEVLDAADAIARILLLASCSPAVRGSMTRSAFRTFQLSELVGDLGCAMAAASGRPMPGMHGWVFKPDGTAEQLPLVQPAQKLEIAGVASRVDTISLYLAPELGSGSSSSSTFHPPSDSASSSEAAALSSLSRGSVGTTASSSNASRSSASLRTSCSSMGAEDMPASRQQQLLHALSAYGHVAPIPPLMCTPTAPSAAFSQGRGASSSDACSTTSEEEQALADAISRKWGLPVGGSEQGEREPVDGMQPEAPSYAGNEQHGQQQGSEYSQHFGEQGQNFGQLGEAQRFQFAQVQQGSYAQQPPLSGHTLRGKMLVVANHDGTFSPVGETFSDPGMRGGGTGSVQQYSGSSAFSGVFGAAHPQLGAAPAPVGSDQVALTSPSELQRMRAMHQYGSFFQAQQLSLMGTLPPSPWPAQLEGAVPYQPEHAQAAASTPSAATSLRFGGSGAHALPGRALGHVSLGYRSSMGTFAPQTGAQQLGTEGRDSGFSGTVSEEAHVPHHGWSPRAASRDSAGSASPIRSMGTSPAFLGGAGGSLAFSPTGSTTTTSTFRQPVSPVHSLYAAHPAAPSRGSFGRGRSLTVHYSAGSSAVQERPGLGPNRHASAGGFTGTGGARGSEYYRGSSPSGGGAPLGPSAQTQAPTPFSPHAPHRGDGWAKPRGTLPTRQQQGAGGSSSGMTWHGHVPGRTASIGSVHTQAPPHNHHGSGKAQAVHGQGQSFFG